MHTTSPTATGGFHPASLPTAMPSVATPAFLAPTAPPAFEVRIAHDNNLGLVLAPLVTFLAANHDRVINPTPVIGEPCVLESPTHRYMVFRLNTSGLSSDFVSRHESLFRLVNANHGRGIALRKPMKFNFAFGLGGLNASLVMSSRLVVAVPVDASFEDCRDQVNSLLKYMLRSAARLGAQYATDDEARQRSLLRSAKSLATFVHGLTEFDPDDQ